MSPLARSTAAEEAARPTARRRAHARRTSILLRPAATSASGSWQGSVAGRGVVDFTGSALRVGAALCEAHADSLHLTPQTDTPSKACTTRQPPVRTVSEGMVRSRDAQQAAARNAQRNARTMPPDVYTATSGAWAARSPHTRSSPPMATLGGSQNGMLGVA